MAVSAVALRRVKLLEQRSPINRPTGGWPAIIRDYDEWSALAEASQVQLLRDTQGWIDETTPPPAPQAPEGKRPPRRKAPTADSTPTVDPTKAYLAAQLAARTSTAPAPDSAVPAWVTEYLEGQQFHSPPSTA